jgi:hypothetical protein
MTTEPNPYAPPPAEVAHVPDTEPSQELPGPFQPLKCRVTVADELALWLYLNTRRPAIVAVHLLFVLLLVASLLGVHDAHGSVNQGVMAFVIYAGLQVAWLAGILHRRWGPGKDRKSSFVFQLTSDGVVVSNSEARIEQRWSVFKQLRVTRDTVFLFMNKMSAYVIPRRMFSDDEGWQTFVSAVREGCDTGKITALLPVTSPPRR